MTLWYFFRSVGRKINFFYGKKFYTTTRFWSKSLIKFFGSELFDMGRSRHWKRPYFFVKPYWSNRSKTDATKYIISLAWRLIMKYILKFLCSHVDTPLDLCLYSINNDTSLMLLHSFKQESTGKTHTDRRYQIHLTSLYSSRVWEFAVDNRIQIKHFYVVM